MALSTDRPGVAERWPAVHLSPMESALLAYLLAAGDRVVTADELLREVWGYHPKAKSTTVKSTVGRIRQKIESDPGRPQQLLALRGRGYQLVLPVETGAAALSQRARSPSVVADPTRFVGRRADLERLHELLDQDRRLVTVHGGPGLGKTRLVRELAPKVTDRFAGGVWFCDLSHTTDTEVAFGVVARVLGVIRAADATSSIVDALVTVLQARASTLLILDNLEQLPHSAHQVLATLLGACPALHLLCTSRVRLQVWGEALHEVAPLAQDEGVSLLRDRIEAIRLDRSRPLEEAVLKDIHALLEGVPLALELAAGRARVLPLRELRCRLTCSFAVLDGQTSNRPQRQQTLHQAIEWSWRLLSAEEASALLQFGAFQSGCSLQVAEDVIRAQPSALDAITSLLDKSLLRSWQTEGQLRIGPYAYVREYILDKGGQALEHARQRHAEWALGLVAQTAASLDVDPEAGTVLIRELDNVLAAADWLVAAGRPEAADLLWNLRHLYYAKRLPTDLPRRLRAARSTLSLSKEQVDRLGLVMARVFGLRREHQRLAAEVERGLARVAPSSALRSDLVLMQARMAFASGNYRGAVELAEQSIKLAEQFGTEETLVRHFNTLGIAHRHLEQHEAAVAACRKAVVEAERVGAERLTATPLSNMAVSFRIQGDARRGLDCLRRAREVAERFKDARMAHWVQAQMAPLHAHLGELELADTLFQRVIADDQRFEQSNLGVGTRVNAGITALLCSDFERAAGVLEDTRQELTDQGRRGATLAICLSSLMVCRAALDDLERAEQVAEVLATIPPLELAPRIRLQLAISHGHLDVLRAVRARERGDAEGANQYRAEAERRCALERDTPEGTGLELVRDLLQRALDRYDART